MAYQSKTYSLSDEVIAAIDAARVRGLTPNKYLRGLIALAAATEAGEFTTLDSVLDRNGRVVWHGPVEVKRIRKGGKR